MTPSRIRRLSQGTVNRIAAGEVIERPASAVKELVENAIDAGATQIDVAFRGGGKSLIRVIDDGFGMNAEELALSVERHATSKIPDDDLTAIATLGFRGEALPSIGSVARLSITSIPRGGVDAHVIALEGGAGGEVKPAALARGTAIEVRDLFYATPARLKFLKQDRSETGEALDVVRRLALAHPEVGFSFANEEREWLNSKPETREARVARVMGAEFMANAVPVATQDQDIVIEGFAGLPTYSRAQGTLQYAVVNGRPVKDKLIMGAVRGAYVDVMPRGRFPAVALFIRCDSSRVDVNVHPAKTEVRFRDPGFVRSLIVSAIRRALAARQITPDVAATKATVSAFRPMQPQTGFGNQPWQTPRFEGAHGFAEEKQSAFEMNMPIATSVAAAVSVDEDYPLGTARAQLHGNYIVAQTATGMILVDQHAAHERIVYERLKRERMGTGVVTQPLLVPEVIDLDPATHAAVLGIADLMAHGGLVVEGFGDQAVIVREVPAALSGGNIPALLRDIADDAGEMEKITTLDEKLNHVLATFACHHSVRSGRTLRAEEMNALLREMEVTPNAGQCNHGRPTFIELKLADIERLFGRS